MLERYLQRSTSAAPLAIFRVAFGLLLFASIVRFWINGWIDELYIQPKYFFPYYGFEFVTPIGPFTYVIFAVCALAALFVAVGWFYRIASVALFTSFTYIELMDKSTYLNHYYFTSMMCLLLIVLPAHTCFSIDAKRGRAPRANAVPLWTIDAIKLFVCILYVCAGLAKINSDWLLDAQPLRTWLPAKNDLPVIGTLFNYTWVAYAFAWIGCLYDLTIPFLLWNNRTRVLAYAAVVVFHCLTAVLFPIGMFPFIMIATGLIFFPAGIHERSVQWMSGAFHGREALDTEANTIDSTFRRRATVAFLGVFFFAQALLPFRHILYPGELFWTEEGYRFSWRVMLMEKAGHAQFIVRDDHGKFAAVENAEFLTPLQEKMMSTQPDMILQFAHILRDHFSARGFDNPRVYADTYVVLNGRMGRPLIDPETDLAKEKDSFAHKPWILPFGNEVQGF